MMPRGFLPSLGDPQSIGLPPELAHEGDARRVALVIEAGRHNHHRVPREVGHKKNVTPVGGGDEDVDPLQRRVQRAAVNARLSTRDYLHL